MILHTTLLPARNHPRSLPFDKLRVRGFRTHFGKLRPGTLNAGKLRPGRLRADVLSNHAEKPGADAEKFHAGLR